MASGILLKLTDEYSSNEYLAGTATMGDAVAEESLLDEAAAVAAENTTASAPPRIRWLVLAAYSTLPVVQNLAYIAYSTVVDETSDFYSVSNNQVQLTTCLSLPCIRCLLQCLAGVHSLSIVAVPRCRAFAVYRCSASFCATFVGVLMVRRVPTPFAADNYLN